MQGSYKVLQVINSLLHYAEVVVSDDFDEEAVPIHPLELGPAIQGLSKFNKETSAKFELHVLSVKYSLVDTLPEDIELAAYMACKNYELKRRRT